MSEPCVTEKSTDIEEPTPVDRRVTIVLQENRAASKMEFSISFDPEVDTDVPHNSIAIEIGMGAIGFIIEKLKEHQKE